ncbi:MAG: cation:proton antiporter regulatory subunit [Desulfopila sp.]|jgi:TrkA domain protein|nr:cation:proton antiporter regulatory subunit [Desulfopila sp.]
MKMCDLPGVGKKISMQTADDDKIVVIVHHSGKRDLYFFKESDEDEADYFISLTGEETRELGAQLLGATYQPVDDEKMRIFQNQLIMEWIKLTAESPVVGKQIAESRIRTLTGASIIAVMHGDEMTVSPDVDFVLRAGDTVMVAGKKNQIATFEKLAVGATKEGEY